VIAHAKYHALHLHLPTTSRLLATTPDLEPLHPALTFKGVESGLDVRELVFSEASCTVYRAKRCQNKVTTPETSKIYVKLLDADPFPDSGLDKLLLPRFAIEASDGSPRPRLAAESVLERRLDELLATTFAALLAGTVG
jgi:hypothetical protein